MTLTQQESYAIATVTSADVYNNTSQISGSRLEYVKSVESVNNTGFKASLYMDNDTGKYVVAYCGSNDSHDVASDGQMTLGQVPAQFNEAKTFMENLNINGISIPPSQIELITGHSLGASLAQMVGSLEAYKGIDTVALNPYGTQGVQDNLRAQGNDLSLDNSNISNYISPQDIVPNSSNQIGNTYQLEPSAAVSNLNNFGIHGTTAYNMLALVLGELIAHKGILDSSQNLFGQAEAATEPIPGIWRDPLLVDLDGDGIETTTLQNGTYFDHDKNGFAQESAWVGADDGVLAFDKNADGVINNGGEIFGDNYVLSNGQTATTGFQALADLDSNSDGVINSSDTNFASIKVMKVTEPLKHWQQQELPQST